MVLRQVIRFLIIEGRLEDTKKKYDLKDEIIETLSKGDPSGNNKYLMWMAKEAKSVYILDEWILKEIIDIVQQFHKHQKRLQKKDINQYEDLEEIKQALDNLPISKTQQKKQTKAENAIVLYEDDDYLLIHPKNKEAVCLYGKNTKWCITDQKTSEYTDYIMDKMIFYFLIDENTNEKLAFIYNNDEEQLESVWDSQDKQIDPLQKLDQEFLNEILKIIKQDAPKRKLNGMFESPRGTKYWYINGQLHREDGPAIEYAHGKKEWYQHGKLHRENGPAIEYVYGKIWYINGQLHREDGPAAEYVDGSKYWYINDIELTEEEFNTRLQSSSF